MYDYIYKIISKHTVTRTYQPLYKHFRMSFKLSMTLHITAVHTESHAACVHCRACKIG